MLKCLLDGVNRQPTETRAKLSVVRFQSHDKLRSGLHWRLRENAKKRCLNKNFLLLHTLYAMSTFFAPDHIKVSIFIKF
jgi:hypothetical protein